MFLLDARGDNPLPCFFPASRGCLFVAPSSIFLSSNTAFLHHHISFSDTPVSLFHFKNHQSLLCWTHPDNKDNLSGFLFFKSTTQFLKIHLFVCIGSYLPHVGYFVAAQGHSSWGCTGLVSLLHLGSLVPHPRVEPMSHALQGGFLTTGPPGKSKSLCFKVS